MNRRVVVTGMAGISPLGNDWLTVRDRLGEYRNAIVHMADWDGYDGLNTRLGAPAAPFELSARYNRKSTRSMGRVALLATRASELALRTRACSTIRCSPAGAWASPSVPRPAPRAPSATSAA
jgi:3-oxoacyl-[acyl-carrier-protein] synthase II